MNHQMDGAPQARGYSDAGASLDRRALRAFLPNSGPPNEDINPNNATLRQRSRMLYMAAPIATGAINTVRTKAVGTGLSLKCAINRKVLGISPEAAKEWQRKTEAEFRMWASRKQNCDALAMNNFDALQQVALLSWLMSGDVFAVLPREKPTPLNPYGLRIQLVEADRISNPQDLGVIGAAFTPSGVKVPEGKPGAGNTIYDGVEVDAKGRVVAYYVASGYTNQTIFHDPIKWTRVLAYGERTGLPNILHVMDCERPDQYRGVPYLAKVIEPILQTRRYTESELWGAIVQSFFTAWIETKTDPSGMPFNETGSGDVAGIPGANPESSNLSKSENEYEMGPGTVIHLAPDETVHFGNPNIPTAGFEKFTDTMAKHVGTALEIPKDVMLKEFNASYSASRGALLEAWEAIKMYRHWFVDDFCQPVYEVWLTEAVALGRIQAPGFFTDPMIRTAWCGAHWIGPVQGQLDPLKEAKAAILLADKGIKTYQQLTREMGGGDWEENVEQLKHENEMLEDAGANKVVELPKESGGGGDGGDGDGD